MDQFNLNDIKDIHVGDLPAAKKGLIDSLLGKDEHKDEVPFQHFSSYKKGHELGTQIENLLKGDQREY
ncbi:hypothetical protein [Clostridium rectalis]|uniref:hypothetical protein n=1 Tax=Clostridium rectalis TaxID=2040295 RepID=UPI001FA9C962|nr:hypothetical protein [Clostridium rectalis]